MASTKNQSHDVTFLVVCVLAFIAGMLVNLFIAAVDFPDWLKGKKIKVCEKIQCVLVLSRMSHLCVTLIRVFTSAAGQDHRFVLNDSLNFIQISFNFAGLWYLTLLTVLFFLKIADCKHVLFLHLKVIISQRLMCFIVGVTLISVSFAALCVWSLKNALTGEQQHNQTNVTCGPRFSVSILYSVTLGNSGPFIPYSVSSILLVTSLCRHMIRMRRSDIGLSKSNLDRYYVAIKSLVVCYLIYALHVGANVLGSTYFSCFGVSGLFVLLNIFPNLHSVYLIYGNSKLRQRFSETIQGAINYLTTRRGAESTQTRSMATIAE